MEAFPDCKFILSMRNPTTWFKSLQTTIRLHIDLRERWPVKMLMYLSGQGKLLKMMTDIDNLPNPEFKG